MGKFYEGNISEVILDKVDIVNLISGYVQLKRTGNNYKGLCPFHNEKTPSFVVSEDKQLYHCFGCGASGNAIGFLMNIENLDFLDTIEFLAEKSGIDLSQYESKKNSSNNSVSYNDKKDSYEILRNAAIFYYKNLKKNTVAKEYLKSRNITDEIIKTFGLGFAEDEWSSLIKHFNSKNLAALEKAGLILPNKQKNGFYDRFRNRIIFPIINVQGKVIGFGGRVIDDSLPKYLNSPETLAFNKSKTLYGLNIAKNNLPSTKRILVVEGYMDVIALNMYGIKNVVATLGTSLTKDHGKLLSRYADEIIVSYDGDSAGQKAAFRSIEVLKGIKSKVKILTLKNGYDPDDYLKKYGKNRFLELLENAKPSIEFVFSVYKNSYDIETEDGRIDYINSCIDYLAKYDNEVVRNIYIEYLSVEVSINLDIIKNELNKKMKLVDRNYNSDDNFVIKSSISKLVRKTKASKNINISRTRKIEIRMLEYSLQDKKYLNKIFDFNEVEKIFNKNIKKIMFSLKEYYKVLSSFDLANAIDYFDLEDLKGLEKVIKNMVPISDDDKHLSKLLRQHLKICLDIEISQNKSELIETIKKISNNSDDNLSKIELNKTKEVLNERIKELNKKLSKITGEI
ncbi:DNA primase [Helicovermis profundi]|uniref:DNA primase n=1 Tax=Helicovermis profundi TaxID=3065157 RepID=A0AAU9E5C7_9FIRM|nr:DNA primase [Clostridia bacterium S502]